MVFSNRASKFLMIIILSTLIVSIKSTKVLADSKLPININKQIQFLEEKRKSQSEMLAERQKNTTVEDRRNAEKKKEKAIKREKKNETDTFSEMVKGIRKSQSKKGKLKKVIHKKSINEKLETENEISRAERIQLSEPIANNTSEMKEDTTGNSLLGELEILKDLIDQPVQNNEPIDMAYTDIEMLENIVMAESGGEPYLGQIAVANVVLNRVKSNKYPATLKGVIFQKSQFSPVKNGVIRGRAPNESVKKAVAEALGGRMIVPEDTLYFVNPVLATDQTIPRTKTTVKVIGNHTFYK